MRSAFVLSLCVGLVGCAEFTEWSCANTDPLSRGERLARQGAPESALAREVATCAATPTPLRADLLAAGHARGRAIHCTPRGAFEAGRGGHRLGDFCPASERPALRAAHRQGVLLDEIEDDIRDLRREITILDKRLDNLDSEDPERAGARRALRRAERRLDRLESRRFLLRARAW